MIVGVDDILVSGASDEDHLNNLEEVLKRVPSAGLRLGRTRVCSWNLKLPTWVTRSARKEFNR